ncbi:MAG: cyanophycin synthetase, partial [Bacilli bacterium]
DYTFEDPKFTIDGTEFFIHTPRGKFQVATNLLGRFNIYNILAFIAVVDVLALFSKKIFEFLSARINILGRMEVLNVAGRYFVIDFAHTPDGVRNVLEFLDKVKKNKLYVVIGCGGERDKGKRRVIGDITATIADFVIFTNDNPRFEPPEEIIADILEGVKSDNYIVIIDRETAIVEASRRALKGDIIAVLGKGNEQYQIIRDKKIPYNDKNTVRRLKL